MGRPPWRYALTDGQLHMIRREVHDVAEALCPLRVTVADLRAPGDEEDQPRCPVCIRVYGTELFDPVEQMLDYAGEPLRAVARSRTRQETTAATPEQVDLVIELGALARAIVDHNHRVMAREPVEWAELAEALSSAARSCRGQVVLDLGDGGGVAQT